MARDPKKYYPRPGIPKDGPLLRYLLADAQKNGKSVNTMMTIRLLEFYEGRTFHEEKGVPQQQQKQEKAFRNARAFLEEDE